MAVAAGDLTAPGLTGAGVGLVLAGALAAVVATTDTALGDSVGWLLWLVVLPLSPLVGYDLATRGGRNGDGPLLRAGGYSVAVAAAHLVTALGVAACVGWGIDARSPLWFVALAAGVLVVPPARAGAVRAVRGLRAGGWGLVGAAVLILLMALIVHMAASGFWLARIDS